MIAVEAAISIVGGTGKDKQGTEKSWAKAGRSFHVFWRIMGRPHDAQDNAMFSQIFVSKRIAGDKVPND